MKEQKQKWRLSKKFEQSLQLVYTVILGVAILISCEVPAMEIEVVVVDTVVDEPIIDEVIVDDPVIITEPIVQIIEEITEMTMNPIKVYEKYAVDESNKVFGLKGNSREVVVLKDTDEKIHAFNDFFKVGGEIFFQVKEIVIDNTDSEKPTSEEVTNYFSQVDSKVSEILETEYSAKPESKYAEMGITPFSIKTVDNKGSNVSYVGRDTLNIQTGEIEHKPTGFKMIDGYCSVNDGLWFSVPETIATRLKGVYFYPVDGNLSSSPVMLGRIW